MDPRVIAAAEELENSSAQGAEREEILRKYLSPAYEKGYRGTAWNLHGISVGLTPERLSHLLEAHGESFDPCAERETFDHSLMVNVEEELASQLDDIRESVLNDIVEEYKVELLAK